MALVFPDISDDSTCVLLFVPVELVPIVGSLFAQLEARRKWATADDWQQGYRAFIDLQDQLMNNCLETLIQEIRALRGVKPEYAGVAVEDRTTDMYRDFNDLIGHLNPIIFALRGGEDPEDNILQALRGDTAADDTRNVIDLLS